MKITMTLPTRIGKALLAAADEFEMTPPDFLKSVLFAATNLQSGYTLKLELPPLPASDLPLLEAAGVSLEG